MQAEVINDEYLKPVMEEVAREITKIYPRKRTQDQEQALTCFFMTLSKMTINAFDWLPPQEANHVITTCGTWFDIGMLFGKSPELLVKILEKVDPGMNKEELPDWLAVRLKGGK